MEQRGRDGCVRCRAFTGRVLVLLVLGISLLVASCHRRHRSTQDEPGPGARDQHSPTLSRERPEELASGTEIGKARVFGNLTVFPVLARSQPDLGRFTTLPRALEKKEAEVREVNADEEHGGSVGTLLIENRGDVSIYVLAGTVVKGGKQDRQIGQDFLVQAHTTIPVDAFCVEHGRWSAERRGVATQGKFAALKTLANAKVRAAGQYQGNQGAVWDEVDRVNSANAKVAETRTLTATLDDEQIRRQQEGLARQVSGHLEGVQPPGAVVGLAYAVDGEVKAVRWFANHDIFSLFRETLVNTAAVDAITARAGQPPKTPPPVAPTSVRKFVAKLDSVGTQQSRKTSGQNTNDYAKAAEGYRSETKLKPAASAAPRVISKDYVSGK